MRLYIAAKNLAAAQSLRNLLISDGHQITSRWITQDKKFGTGADYSDEEYRAMALMDQADVQAAIDGLVLIADPESENGRGGKHVETGMALALGRQIFVVGRKENIFHWHPLVEQFANEASLRERLRKNLKLTFSQVEIRPLSKAAHLSS